LKQKYLLFCFHVMDTNMYKLLAFFIQRVCPSFGCFLMMYLVGHILRAISISAISIGVLSFSFFVVATGLVAAETTWELIQRTGEVRIGYANEFPFAFRKPDGQVTGEAPEIARQIFAALGIPRVQAVETEFGLLIRDLLANRFDVIAAGMYVLPERCRQILFSEPSYRLGTGFLVRSGNPKNLHGYDDVVANSSVRLGVVSGAVEGDQARAAGVPDHQIVVYPDTRTAAGGVKSGRIDAFAATALTVQGLAERAPRLLSRADPFHDPVTAAPGHGAFGLRPEDRDLRDVFNRVLSDFIGTPRHLGLIAPFSFTRAELPDRTTAELCAG
jgi:polar amino acid transport system substrate-binding protein